MYALLKADLFNLLCVPPDARFGTIAKAVRGKAAALCRAERALYIVDPPAFSDASPSTAAATVSAEQLDPNTAVLSLTDADDAALVFPRIRRRDPLRATRWTRSSRAEPSLA